MDIALGSILLELLLIAVLAWLFAGHARRSKTRSGPGGENVPGDAQAPVGAWAEGKAGEVRVGKVFAQAPSRSAISAEEILPVLFADTCAEWTQVEQHQIALVQRIDVLHGDWADALWHDDLAEPVADLAAPTTPAEPPVAPMSCTIRA